MHYGPLHIYVCPTVAVVVSHRFLGPIMMLHQTTMCAKWSLCLSPGRFTQTFPKMLAFFLKNGIGLQYLIVKTLNNIIRLVDTVQLKASFQIRPFEYLIAQTFSHKGLPKSWITCFIDKQNAVKTSSRKEWDLRNQYQTTADFEGNCVYTVIISVV